MQVRALSLGQMTNKEKFLLLVSEESSETMDLIRYRIANRENLREKFKKDMKQLTEQQIDYYKKTAKKETSQEYCSDEWNPFEISGGNFDDAYQLGCDDNEIENARFILSLFGIEYKEVTNDK